ncbi:MAG TPA: hypothetical protein VFE28_00280, partial [Candidatus Krumholzibacteria bacterium]|nr:hypothetical protein [Candidatus Krumholzibacteria bacterium]
MAPARWASTPPPGIADLPQLGLAKSVSAGPVNHGDGTHTVTYRIRLENRGDETLSNLQVTDDLAATFAAATSFSVSSVSSSDFATNPAFDGSGDTNLLAGSDSLAVGGSGVVDLTVTVTTGEALGPYDNSATGSALGAGGSPVSDVSTAGSDPDPDGNGDPSDDATPTEVTFSESPEIGVAKAVVAGPTNNGDGTYTLTYRVRVENSGDVTIHGVQVTDNLTMTFGGAAVVVEEVTGSGLTASSNYNGTTHRNLLAGTDLLATGVSGSVDLRVRVTPGSDLGPYGNSATGSATSTGGTPLNDASTAGATPDANGNGDPGDDSAPTNVTFSESPELGVAKTVVGSSTNNGNGTYTLTYRIRVENSGDVPVHSVQVTDNLTTTFAGATILVEQVTATGLKRNSAYNGTT